MLSIVGGGIQRLSATVYIAVSFFPLPLCFFFFISLCKTCIGGSEIRVSLDFKEISCSSLAAVMKKKTVFFFFFFFWNVSILLCAKRRLVVGMLWLSRGGLECLWELSLVYVRWCFGKMA